MIDVIDLYKNLFGRKGIDAGNVIDMSEHGRAGGISSGQPFKFTREIDEKVIIDEVDDSTTYIGRSQMGGETDAEIWQIKRVAVAGGVTSITFADGDANYNNVWDDRASLSYS